MESSKQVPILTRSEKLCEVSDVLRTRVYRKGLTRFLADFAVCWLLLWAACTLPVYKGAMICAIVAGFWVGRLFVLAHDAAHNTLTPSRRFELRSGSSAPYARIGSTFRLDVFAQLFASRLFANQGQRHGVATLEL